MSTEVRIRLTKIFLWVFCVIGFIWWPLSHWFFPGFYHKILGFASYENSYVKVIGTLSFIPIMMMFFSALNPVRNKDMIKALIASGILMSFAYIYLILTGQFPKLEYINAGITFILAIVLLIIYPWRS